MRSSARYIALFCATCIPQLLTTITCYLDHRSMGGKQLSGYVVPVSPRPMILNAMECSPGRS